YAMTAHLALNLVWLWLFLRDTPGGHAAAAGVGFVACGLHQVAFHPLFVAPFLLSVLIARRWKLAAFYAVAYGAIGLFLLSYWSLILRAADAPAAQATDVGLMFFIARATEMFSFGIDSIAHMARSLFRFLTWQNPLTVPLALVGLFACRDRTAINLAGGAVL